MAEANTQPPRIKCLLIAGGVWHDIDYARLEILKLLGTNGRVRTRVFEDYDVGDALGDTDMLISYTCNVVPSDAAQEKLRDWLEGGGRWFALHGTNSVLEMLDDGLWSAPRTIPLLADLLGSQFVSHPPIVPYRVTVADPAHPLVAGVEPFDAEDELYHLELHQPIHVLLETVCTETGDGFREGADAPGNHPVMYLKDRGRGGVLYLTLGHCRGHYDLQPMLDWWPSIDRCSWDLPVFRELLARGINWAAGDQALIPQ